MAAPDKARLRTRRNSLSHRVHTRRFRRRSSNALPTLSPLRWADGGVAPRGAERARFGVCARFVVDAGPQQNDIAVVGSPDAIGYGDPGQAAGPKLEQAQSIVIHKLRAAAGDIEPRAIGVVGHDVQLVAGQDGAESTVII